MVLVFGSLNWKIEKFFGRGNWRSSYSSCHLHANFLSNHFCATWCYLIIIIMNLNFLFLEIFERWWIFSLPKVENSLGPWLSLNSSERTHANWCLNIKLNLNYSSSLFDHNHFDFHHSFGPLDPLQIARLCSDTASLIYCPYDMGHIWYGQYHMANEETYSMLMKSFLLQKSTMI